MVPQHSMRNITVFRRPRQSLWWIGTGNESRAHNAYQRHRLVLKQPQEVILKAITCLLLCKTLRQCAVLLILSFDCAIAALNSFDYDDSVLLFLTIVFLKSLVLRLLHLHSQSFILGMILSYLNWPNTEFIINHVVTWNRTSLDGCQKILHNLTCPTN
jgi:hypothetical protein